MNLDNFKQQIDKHIEQSPEEWNGHIDFENWIEKVLMGFDDDYFIAHEDWIDDNEALLSRMYWEKGYDIEVATWILRRIIQWKQE